VALRSDARVAMTLTVAAGPGASEAPGHEAGLLGGRDTRLIRDLVSQVGAELTLSDSDGLYAEVTIAHPAA
jgi:hypothetical protein